MEIAVCSSIPCDALFRLARSWPEGYELCSTVNSVLEAMSFGRELLLLGAWLANSFTFEVSNRNRQSCRSHRASNNRLP